jgi:hypothetical protein
MLAAPACAGGSVGLLARSAWATRDVIRSWQAACSLLSDNAVFALAFTLAPGGHGHAPA